MALSAPLKHARTVLAVALAYVLGLQAFVLAATPERGPVGFQTVLCTHGADPGPVKPGGTAKQGHSCCTSARCGVAAPALATPDVAGLTLPIAIRVVIEPVPNHHAAPQADRRAQKARGPPLTV